MLFIISLYVSTAFASVPMPEIISPTEETTILGSEVVFQWSAIANVNKYELTVYKRSGEDIDWDKYIDFSAEPGDAGCASANTCSYAYLVPYTEAVWKIRAVSTTEEPSEYTDNTSFVLSGDDNGGNDNGGTNTPFGVPKIISPNKKTTISSNRVTFKWNAVANVSKYELEVYKRNGENIIWDEKPDDLPVTPEEAGCANSNTCSYTRIVSYAEVAWKIRAESISEVSSDYTDYIHFTIDNTNKDNTDKTSAIKLPPIISTPGWRTDEIKKTPAPPPFLGTITDPDTGFAITRLGGSKEEMSNASALHIAEENEEENYADGKEGISERHGQHFYSRTNPANSSETYALGTAGGNAKGAILWDLTQKKLVSWVPTGADFDCETSCDYQRQLLWDKKLENVYWYTDGNKLIRAVINFNNGYSVTTSIRHEFIDFKTITFGEGEGDFSDDGKKIVLILSNINTVTKINDDGEEEEVKTSVGHKFVSYIVGNSPSDDIVSQPYDTVDNFDWVAVDPTGDYIVFNKAFEYTKVLDFSNPSAEPRLLYKDAKHSDFVRDKKGDSWIVYGNYQGVFASKLSEERLKQIWPVSQTLSSTRVENGINPDYVGLEKETSASGHISRISGIPGMVLVSRFEDGGLYYLNIDDPEGVYYIGNSRHGKRLSPLVGDEDADAEIDEKWKVDQKGETAGSKQGEPRGSASSSGKYIFFVSDYFFNDIDYGATYNSDESAPIHNNKPYLNLIDLKK